jgi:hypothetical protein
MRATVDERTAAGVAGRQGPAPATESHAAYERAVTVIYYEAAGGVLAALERERIPDAPRAVARYASVGDLNSPGLRRLGRPVLRVAH